MGVRTMNASLEQQQSLLKWKLIQAGKQLQNTQPDESDDDDYDSVAESEEISDTESYDTVCNEGPYRPCPAKFETLVSHGTLEHDYDEVTRVPTFDRLTRNLKTLNYRGYVWGLKEWTIYILRTSKVKLMWRFLIYLINLFLESHFVEIILTLTIIVVYTSVFINTRINDDVVYFNSKSTSLH